MKSELMQGALKKDQLLRSYFDAENLFPSSWLNAFDSSFPQVNISESSNCFCIDVIAPDFTKEDFKVNIEDNIINITVQKIQPGTENLMFINEHQNNVPTRSFRLPDNIQEDLISAAYINDTLKLTIPKHNTTIRKEVQVQ